jgi:hypothetical protein
MAKTRKDTKNDNSEPGFEAKDFGRADLDKQRLGQIINLLSDIPLGIAADRSKDTLGCVRWHCGTPPAGNANYVWVQHFIHHLAASGGSGARTTRRFGAI